MDRGEGRVVPQRKLKVLLPGIGGWVLSKQGTDFHTEGTFADTREGQGVEQEDSSPEPWGAATCRKETVN